MILLDTVFTIYMTGLMTHIGDDRVAGPDLKTHVALVVDRQHMQHRPMICVPGEDLYGGAAGDPPLEMDLNQGDKITFEGLIAGRALASPDFRSYVPTLEEPLTNALLHDKPRANVVHDDVAASMTFPRGDLNIAWYHKDQGDFMRDGEVVRSQCVPETTIFTTNSTYNTDRVTMLVTHKQGLPTMVDLKPDAVVAVWNQPDSATTPEMEAHFTNYIGVLKPRFLLSVRRVATVRRGNPCLLTLKRPDPLPMCTPTSIADPEAELHASVAIVLSDHPSCTNTDWP